MLTPLKISSLNSSVVLGFSNIVYGEKRKSTESFLNQKTPIVNCKTPILISNEMLRIKSFK